MDGLPNAYFFNHSPHKPDLRSLMPYFIFRVPYVNLELMLMFSCKTRSLLNIVLVGSLLLNGCKNNRIKGTLFQELSPEATGISFQNTVVQDGENNVMNYIYYFNGGGVAVGDINNDGLSDIYFSGNQVSNKLYLNKGDFEFEDITEKAGVGASTGWKTGVTMADIN